jgi:hypothetical protein
MHARGQREGVVWWYPSRRVVLACVLGAYRWVGYHRTVLWYEGNKLELMDDWERMQKEQSLRELIQKIEWVCVGFDNHKQEVYNLVQALKTLFLYTQGE